MFEQTLSNQTSQLQQQLTSLQSRLDKLQAVHDQLLSDHATQSAASDQLRRELVDRKKERNQAVFDRDSLRSHLAQLASCSLLIPLIHSSTPANSTPQGVPEPPSSVPNDPPRKRSKTKGFLPSTSAPSKSTITTSPSRSIPSARSGATFTRSVRPTRSN